MNNDITINIEELLKAGDNSITDGETIRQIGLLSCTVNNVSDVDIERLGEKVKREYQFMGLYPNVMKAFDILPDGVEPNEAMINILNNIRNERNGN